MRDLHFSGTASPNGLLTPRKKPVADAAKSKLQRIAGIKLAAGKRNGGNGTLGQKGLRFHQQQTEIPLVRTDAPAGFSLSISSVTGSFTRLVRSLVGFR